MSGYQKLRGAVSKHRLAIKTAELAMQKKNLLRVLEEEDKVNQEEREKRDAADLAKERATSEMVLREKKLLEMTNSLNKKKEELKHSFEQNLVIAEESAGEKDFVKMCFKRPEQPMRHVRCLLREVRTQVQELEAAFDEEERRSLSLEEKKSLVSTLELRVNKAEAELQEDLNALSKEVLSCLRANLRTLSSDDLSKKFALKDRCKAALARVEDLRSIPDSQTCISKNLLQAEEKFRQSWAKLSPKLDDTVYSALVHSDVSVDSAGAALNEGNIAKAVKELQKAEQALEKARHHRGHEIVRPRADAKLPVVSLAAAVDPPARCEEGGVTEAASHLHRPLLPPPGRRHSAGEQVRLNASDGKLSLLVSPPRIERTVRQHRESVMPSARHVLQQTV
eukprot:754403-Hanusia_phi.AAC.2